MRIVFMGTPDFAVPCLESIIKAGHELVGVFTQPDKPKGRGYSLTPPPVKVAALEKNIKVFQPTTIKDGKTLDILKELAPQCIVVVAYGKILPVNILNLPRFGCINIHASLLPKYRGAAPIQWSIINGERETGVTAMYMNQGLDTGDIIKQKVCNIEENETSGDLHDKLSALGAELIVEVLDDIENNISSRKRQDDSHSCYSPMLDKSLCAIDWSLTAREVHNKVRGLNPWPVATSMLDGQKVKIYKTTVCDKGGVPGSVISLSPLTVACGSGSVVIQQLQLEGKKRMDSTSFLNGHRIELYKKFQ